MTASRDRRTAAEWVNFTIAAALVLAVAGAQVARVLGPESPAAPVARPAGPVTERGGMFQVPVDVVNRGDEAAANVQVNASLEIDGETFDGDQTLAFLSGRETLRVVFVFDEDPDEGDLSVQVTGFSEP